MPDYSAGMCLDVLSILSRSKLEILIYSRAMCSAFAKILHLDIEFLASEIFVKILTHGNSIFHGKEVESLDFIGCVTKYKHSAVRAREFSINRSVIVWFAVKINRRTVVTAETRWASRIGRSER